jgi:hypothetical protein
MSNFEDQLWSQLVRERTTQMRAAPKAAASLASSVTAAGSARSGASRTRRPALLTGTGLGIAGLATAGVVALGAISAGAAYAVTTNPDGTVSIRLSELSSLPALNQKLAQDGLPITAVPLNASCATTESLLGVLTSWDGQDTTGAITINPSQIPSGDVEVIGASQTSSGGVTLVAGAMTAPAPSCLNSTAFATPIQPGAASAARASSVRHAKIHRIIEPRHADATPGTLGR